MRQLCEAQQRIANPCESGHQPRRHTFEAKALQAEPTLESPRPYVLPSIWGCRLRHCWYGGKVLRDPLRTADIGSLTFLPPLALRLESARGQFVHDDR